jgi:DNA-binding MarR family transcriptional regulator
VAVDEDAEEAVSALEAKIGELWRTGRARMREHARRVHPDLDPATYPLLAVLVRHGAQRVSELGLLLELDKSTVSRQIDAAARLGMVERVPDPTDARARLAGLTPLGQERMTALHTEQMERWRRSLTTWDPADLRQLIALLQRLSDTGIA